MPDQNADNQDQNDSSDNQDQQNDQDQNQNNDQKNDQNDDAGSGDFSWKSSLSDDVQGSPTLKKFSDDKIGLENAFKSHLSLEKMMGHEKIPVPKDANDVEARQIFNKAMGIPEDPSGYALSNLETPDPIKGVSQSKEDFAKMSHKYGLTPDQADGLWRDYNANQIGSYEKAMGDYKGKVEKTKNDLTQEWGDGYNVKINQAQSVINQFGKDKETKDFLTASLVADPRGAKFLADIGHQFAENQIGEFSKINYSRTPDEARSEVDKIMANKGHDYYSEDPVARNKAIEYVNSLLAVATGQGKS